MTSARRRDRIETLIFRRQHGARLLQHSPVVPDVWLHFGMNPTEPARLLLVPTYGSTPGRLATDLRQRFSPDQDWRKCRYADWNRKRRKKYAYHPEVADGDAARIHWNQSTVAAKLGLAQLVRLALPLTNWWSRELQRLGPSRVSLAGELASRRLEAPLTRQLLREDLAHAAPGVRRPRLTKRRAQKLDNEARADAELIPAELSWLARVVGSLAHEVNLTRDDDDWLEQFDALAPGEIVKRFLRVLSGTKPYRGNAQLWQVNRNRKVEMSVFRSTQTVKADAAQRLFDVRGRGLTWAVVDSGIDAMHPAFRKRDRLGHALPRPFEERVTLRGRRRKVEIVNQTRVVKALDFSKLEQALTQLAPDDDEHEDLRRDIARGRDVDWSLIEPLITIKPHKEKGEITYDVPASDHGTHVAGILAGDWRPEDNDEDILVEGSGEPARQGMCPELDLVDLRVVGADGRGDEFAVLAALQWVRWHNERRDRIEIAGVNVSLSMTHEVSNYACGRTPVCEEATRLVDSGVIVVAAAGNNGRTLYLTSTGQTDEGYRAISITDPGNADDVITVGSTHRSRPQTYGVSFFSSRGPTGDGRHKPDLVAPGEKIRGPAPGSAEKDLDGTSMAAPHVSGAAALLINRHRDLLGEPREVRRILMDTATDLGRDRNFQGAGLVDVLRALQSR